MSTTVSLSNFIGTIQVTPYECEAYLNKQTGELVMISDEENRAIEEGRDLQRYPQWQQEAIKRAKEVFEDEEGSYLLLPNQYAMNEYEMVEAFCYGVQNDHLRDKLIRQIRGSGAFRRFKKTIRRYNVEQDWYRFRDQAYKKIAIDWLERRGIAYEYDVK
ncbi:MAG: UPF0158 family protein [Ardenticatenaceae bacterium]